MKHGVMTAFCLAIVLAGPTWAVAQSSPLPPSPPLPPTASQGERVRIIERDVEFIGPRRGGPEVGIDTWELTPRMLTRLADELALTPAQQGKIAEIMATYRPKMRDIREQLMNESRRLRDTGPEASDFDTLSRSAAARVGGLSADLVTQGSALRKEVWGVLTPEQRSQLERRQAQRQERREERRERRWQSKEKERHERD